MSASTNNFIFLYIMELEEKCKYKNMVNMSACTQIDWMKPDMPTARAGRRKIKLFNQFLQNIRFKHVELFNIKLYAPTILSICFRSFNTMLSAYVMEVVVMVAKVCSMYLPSFPSDCKFISSLPSNIFIWNSFLLNRYIWLLTFWYYSFQLARWTNYELK